VPLEFRIGAADQAARDRILEAIYDAAQAAEHPFDVEELLVEATDAYLWLGGLTARITQRWAFVHLLAVAPHARGQRLGTRLMQALEDEARRRGLLGIWLDTYSFQAPGFYAKLGFQEVGRIPDYPPGHARIFLAKRLDGALVAQP
jgi:ribosomal protein S18 acetylase RimI-like enzyme